MTTTESLIAGESPTTGDRWIVLHGFDWDGLQTLHRLRGEGRWRIAYLDGAVELMSPSNGHEVTKGFLGRLVEAYCLARGIPFVPTGAWTLNARNEEASAEPDESYCFGADAREHPLPELVVEVAWSRGGIGKLEIYRRLGVREVWFWEDDAIRVFVLGPEGYEPSERSTCLPDLDLAMICKLCAKRTLNDAIAALHEALRKG